jgi:hypothetical protein
MKAFGLLASLVEIWEAKVAEETRKLAMRDLASVPAVAEELRMKPREELSLRSGLEGKNGDAEK